MHSDGGAECRAVNRSGSAMRARILFLLALLCATYASGQQLPPYDYYASASNVTGSALKSALHEIIKGHTVVPYSPSSQTVGALSILDQDPANPANVILIYSGFSVPADTFGSGSGKWNREHLWPQSYGVTTGRTSVATSDLNNLRPCNSSVNTSRGNKYFDVSTPPITYPANAPGSSYDSNSWEPRDEDKGAIARSMFYMAVRYDGSDPSVPDLELSDTPNAAAYVFGRLTALLDWNRRFPVTDAERTRNGLIYQFYQRNRNPFVDNPDFADRVFLGVDGFTAWKNRHFSPAELTDLTESGAEADPDGDGIPNLAEYAFGHDPHEADAGPIESVTVQTDGATNYLSITHHRNHYGSGIAIAYETSTDLISWEEIVPDPIGATQIDPQVDRVTVRIPVGTDATFVRFKVVWPLP
jgi:endonuclease I